jgi:hypothetical protein
MNFDERIEPRRLRHLPGGRRSRDVRMFKARDVRPAVFNAQAVLVDGFAAAVPVATVNGAIVPLSVGIPEYPGDIRDAACIKGGVSRQVVFPPTCNFTT